ncbi:DUF3578 domain-containing protein [Solibacillus sp. FSL R5-0691]|uniref:MrcB family domain-containing protein n=1 Tax=Solibacillus sp. FSL R5-0691 TaxID=2921653 RepID=UPI0030D289D5
MVGLESIRNNGVNVGKLVEEFLNASKIKKGDFSRLMDISRNTLTQNLQKEDWSNEQILKTVDVINELTLNGDLVDGLKLFPIAIPAFLERKKGVVNGLVGRTIKVGLKGIFTEVTEANEFKDNLIVDASLGQGSAARSVWIGIRDDRISKSGFSEGVYVVLLFDSNGENAFLSIAYAVSDKDPKKLEEMAKVPAQKIMEVIAGDSRFEGIEPGAIDLGDTKGTVAEHYEKSVIVSKKYSVTNMDKAILKQDLSLMLELFYDFVFEDYFEVLEKTLLKNNSEGEVEQSVDSNSKQLSLDSKSKSKIDPDLHKKLLAAKAEHNSKVGKEAEDFVFKQKIQQLRDSGYNDLVSSVKHVSLELDGHGFDIQSIEVNSGGIAEKVYLEVKGSSMGGKKDFTFYLSERELQVAKELKDKYKLVLVEYVGYAKQRIFAEFSPFPNGDDEDVIEMKPIMYKCKFEH